MFICIYVYVYIYLYMREIYIHMCIDVVCISKQQLHETEASAEPGSGRLVVREARAAE